jgi:hypothetical protein
MRFTTRLHEFLPFPRRSLSPCQAVLLCSSKDTVITLLRAIVEDNVPVLHIRLWSELNHLTPSPRTRKRLARRYRPFTASPVRKLLCTNLSPGQNARLSPSTTLVLVQPPRGRLFPRFSAMYAGECATIRDDRQERRIWVERMKPRQGAPQGAAPGIEKRLKNVDVKYVAGSSIQSFQWHRPQPQALSRTLCQAVCL